MHALRARASRCAKKTRGSTPNWNPYAHQAWRALSKQTGDLETGDSSRPIQERAHSEGCLSATDEIARAEKIDNIVNGQSPTHASTMPAAFRSEESVTVNGGRTEEQSKASLRINDSMGTTITSSGRRRRRFLDLSKIHENLKLKKEKSAGAEKPKSKLTAWSQVRSVLFRWINIMLIAVPIGFALEYAHVGGLAVFIVNFIAIVPLAGILSGATEELALHIGETLGGLLNATFGNAVELIVAVQALIQGKIVIVKTSLIGSMLSNLLFVLGMAFWLGGINRIEQYFNVTVAQTASSLLALAIGSLIIPTVFRDWSEADEDAVDKISYGTSIILLFIYGCYLLFQLRTHITMYNAPSPKSDKKKSAKVEEGAVHLSIANIGAGSAAASGGHINQSKLVKREDGENTDDEDDDDDEPELTILGGLITLAISTVLIAFCSEFMVSSIDELVQKSNISEVFVGLILLPIVGNAAEHATAVTVAIKDKMDLSIGVAIGSSMQIALLVLPLSVILGWILDRQCMTLYFDGFQIAVLFVAVLLVNYLIQDGKSHWLEGVLLMSTYLIIAVAAIFYPHQSEWGNVNGQCFRPPTGAAEG